MKTPAAIIPVLLAVVLTCWPAATASAADAAETNAVATEIKTAEAVSTQDVLRAYLQLQEQLRGTQLAVERTRQEAEAAATRNAEATAARLQLLEQSLTAQRAREFEAMQNANHMLLVLGGTIACMGFFAMVLSAWLQWRATGRLTELAGNLSAARSLGPGWNAPGLGAGESHFSVEALPETNTQLSGAIGRLEQRILELEHAAAPPLRDVASNGAEATAAGADGNSSTQSGPAARITLLLGKGQSLLNLDQTDEAMVCFDEVLALDQNNTDALVKKGVALERQRKLDEAIECYDRAIAADDSVAIAYLYKGGICNRLERFSEALECYEHALRAQEKRRAS